MKRTFISLFLIVIVIITMTACRGKNVDVNTSQNGDSVKQNNNITNSSTNASNTTSKTDNSAKEDQSDTKETYYGKWIIKKQIAYGPVGTYSNDDIKKMLGKEISYSNEKAMYETNVCEKPAYQKSTISQADFEANNRIKFSKLGVTDTSIVQVIVYTDSSYKDIWNGNGCIFYIKDPNTLILFDGGVYFELDREDN